MRQELLRGLTDDQIAKVRAISDTRDLLVLAQDEGVELTDEQLEAVSGGACAATTEGCPSCGSTHYTIQDGYGHCAQCKKVWYIGGVDVPINNN